MDRWMADLGVKADNEETEGRIETNMREKRIRRR